MACDVVVLFRIIDIELWTVERQVVGEPLTSSEIVGCCIRLCSHCVSSTTWINRSPLGPNLVVIVG